MDGSEFLQTSHPPEAEHRPLPSSEWQVRILGPVVQPATRLLPVDCSDFFQSGTVGLKSVRHDDLGLTVLAHCLLKEFQRGLLVACLRHKAFEHFAFVIDGPPKIMPLAVDLHEDFVQMPTPLA